MKEKILNIINHYGVSKQLKYFQSEVFELNEAIIQYEMAYGDMCYSGEAINNQRQHIAEEIADVRVMLRQFQDYYDISTEEIEKIMDYKVERQLKRIEEEK